MNETGPVTVRRLKIWQEGMTLVEKVYLASEEWPTAEVYGLTSQVRRAAVSVPANIAEGVGRGSSEEVARFCRIALASAYELHTLLELSIRLKFTTADNGNELFTLLESLTRQISSFIQYQEKQRE